MHFAKGEIIFDSRKEALKYHEDLREEGLVLYNCDRCGISFATLSPFLTDYGIVCSVCAILDTNSYRSYDIGVDNGEYAW